MEAFVYKWTHTPTLKWYVGYHKGSIDDGYICSDQRRKGSPLKQSIIDNPNNWVRTIIETGSCKDMFALETEILQLFDARSDPRSFNASNNDGKCFGKPGDAVGEKNSFFGKKHSSDLMKQIVESCAKTRASWSAEKKADIIARTSKSLMGRKKPSTHGPALSKWRTGTKFINKDGILKFVKSEEYQSYLDEGWHPGRK
jgi:hypothetical protein